MIINPKKIVFSDFSVSNVNLSTELASKWRIIGLKSFKSFNAKKMSSIYLACNGGFMSG